MAKHTKDVEEAVAVIGLGRFGSSLALELDATGVDVLAIDHDPKLVQQLANRIPRVVCADTTKEEVLRQLGVHEYRKVVVAIGTDMEASILTASLLLAFGVPKVWAKAINAAHGKILDRLGVHTVVYPEHDMGQRVAHLVRGRMQDYIEFEGDFSMVKTNPPRAIVGLPLRPEDLLKTYGVTLVAVRRSDGFVYATPGVVLQQSDSVIVAGRTKDVERFSELD